MYKALCLVVTALFTLAVNGNGYEYSDINLVTAVQTESGNLKIIAWYWSSAWYAGEIGHFMRAGDNSAGAISELATAVFEKERGWPEKMVTAVRDDSGYLKIILWNIGRSTGGEAHIGRVTDIPAGKVGLVSACAFEDHGMFATAVQDGDGNLNVTTWYADHYTIERRSSASAGRVGLVSVCPLSAPFSPDVRYVLATAVQDGDGNLKVIIWYVDGEGNLERKGSASAGPISLVSVIPIDFMDFEPTVLSTVVKTDSGDLKVIIWEVDDEGNLVRRGSASAGSVGLISAADLTRVGIDGGRFVIAVQDGDGTLKIIGWNVDKESLEVTRLGSATAGAVSLISCCRYPFLDEFLFGGFVTAIRDGSGNLKIIGWIMDRDGNLERNYDGSAGRIGLVSAQAVDLTPL